MQTYLSDEHIGPLIRTREKFSHKGTYGHALLIAGSRGKTGAAVLASRACLRSGVGLLTVHTPLCGLDVLQVSVPEAMCVTDVYDTHSTALAADLSAYSAIGIGPGIGTHEDTLNVLIQALDSRKPCVIDADALNLLSENRILFQKLHGNVIITPHPKEFERLTGKPAEQVEQHQQQLEFAGSHGCVVVLKGAETTIALPDGTVFTNTNGNPGMATGGSGDVLTGIILGLLAQGYSVEHAAKIGVFHHGQSGDKAAAVKGQNALIASDIIDFLKIGF